VPASDRPASVISRQQGGTIDTMRCGSVGGVEEHPSAPGMVFAGSCDQCGVLFHPPRGFCPECMSSRVRVEEVEGRGTVYSFTEVHLGVSDAFRDRVPYTMALVETRGGLRILTDIIDASARAVEIGQEVEPVHDRDDTGRVLLFFRRAEK